MKAKYILEVLYYVNFYMIVINIVKKSSFFDYGERRFANKHTGFYLISTIYSANITETRHNLHHKDAR